MDSIEDVAKSYKFGNGDWMLTKSHSIKQVLTASYCDDLLEELVAIGYKVWRKKDGFITMRESDSGETAVVLYL